MRRADKIFKRALYKRGWITRRREIGNDGNNRDEEVYNVFGG